MTDTINNQIPFVPENTIDPAAGLNLSLNTVDALLQVLVQTVGANTPPTGVEGQRFIVGTAPTGAWAGRANKLARFLDGAWQFFDARYVLNAADGALYVRSASTWAALSGGGGGSGTVTSVALSAPTGFDVAGSPVTTAGTLALSFSTGYSLPTDTAQGNWNTAFGWGNHAGAGYEKELTAGTNITIDRTDPDNPVISATGGGGGGSGDVVGPAGAVNNGVALFDGTTGKLLKDGGVLGSAAFTASTAYATAAQGTTADSALQPGAIGVTVQGYSANLAAWSALATSAKQDTLVSATNIKTINGASILGSGDLVVSGSSVTLGTPVTASGTAVDFTGLPAGIKKLSMAFSGISTNGTSAPVIRIGDSGGVSPTGYSGSTTYIIGSGVGGAFLSTGIDTVGTGITAAFVLTGKLDMVLLNASTNTWAFSFSGSRTDGTVSVFFSSGAKSLSAVLDRIRLTTFNGTDSFDAGSVNISYQV